MEVSSEKDRESAVTKLKEGFSESYVVEGAKMLLPSAPGAYIIPGPGLGLIVSSLILTSASTLLSDSLHVSHTHVIENLKGPSPVCSLPSGGRTQFYFL